MALKPFFGRNNRNFCISGAALSFWDPLSSFNKSTFDPSDAFSVFKRPFFGRASGAGMVDTKIDWVETPDAHVIKADIPGMKKDEVKVEVVDGITLSISGERKEEQVQETYAWRFVERPYGKFSRTIELSENANFAEVDAKVENGVLTVTVPKRHSDPARVRAIDVQ